MTELSPTDEYTKERRLTRVSQAAKANRELQPPAHARQKSLHHKPKAAPAEQPWIVRVFTGINVPPAYVRAARGLVYLAVIAAFNLAILHFRQIPAWGVAEDNAIVVGFLIAAEAIFDQLLKGGDTS